MRRLILAALAVAPLAANAGEIATLTNGYTMRCDHHASVAGKVRLFVDKEEQNYIDLPLEQVASFATVGDEPAGTAPQPTPSPAAQKADAKLNPVDLHQILAAAGDEHNLNVELLASVVHTESGGNAQAVSRAGARGLMQLMPQTASEMGVKDSFAAKDNVQGGTAYLDQLLTRYRDNLALALAAYNAGPAAVDKYRGIPPYRETRAYVARVIHEYNRRIRAREAEARRQSAQAVAAPASR